nr:putative integron gene cassette protein [uncultured bacterium]
MAWTIHRMADKPGLAAQNWFCAPASFWRERVTTDGVQLRSSCTEYVADGCCELQRRSVGDPHVEKILVWRRLTPELSRTAARHGVMVHVTI